MREDYNSNRETADEFSRRVKNEGLPWYEYPCSKCFFRGVSEGALKMHINLVHIINGEF